MNTRKLKLGLEIGFYAFLMFVLLGGLVIAYVQLYLMNPILFWIAVFMITAPFFIGWFLVKYKIVRRE